MSATKPFAHISKDLGRYNWASTEKDWQVALRTHVGVISQKWPENEEPNIDGLLPTEVLDLIEERLDSYWISTGRERDKAVIATVRESGKEIDAAWLRSKIESHERKLKELRSALERIEGDV